MDTEKIGFLKRKSMELRKHILGMIHKAGSGHPGGALSAADIVTALYYDEMNVKPEEPDWAERDRFILSKGHACPALYAVLAMKGYFPLSELNSFRCINGRLQGHPDMKKTPGVDSTSGSLGNGLSIGLGMSLAIRVKGRPGRVYVMLGCGELDEGMVWEAAMSAAKFKLDNLLAIIDYNRLQIDGTNDEILPLEPLEDKWRSFGWNTVKIDGHDFQQIMEAFSSVRKQHGVPSVIVADTVKGKGVSYMENQLEWHGKAPNDHELETALAEVERPPVPARSALGAADAGRSHAASLRNPPKSRSRSVSRRRRVEK